MIILNELTNTKMNVLSLFDGMSCGQIALERAGVNVENYFASEIDKYAIKVCKANYPNTKHIGSVVDVTASSLPSIDLLIGGSPCQGFSFAGKQLNFEDPRSKLFFEYVRLLNEIREINPNLLFLLENVSMKKEYQDVITQHLGVEPIIINSNLVSAQNRKRIYWTNIPNVTRPNDKNIFLNTILHEFIDDRSSEIFKTLSEYIVPFDKTLQILDKQVKNGKAGYFRKDSQANRVYYINDKAITLCGDSGGGAAKMGQYLFGDYIRKLTPIECERLQTVPDNYTNHVSNSQRYKMLGNGWTVSVISHIFKGLL